RGVAACAAPPTRSATANAASEASSAFREPGARRKAGLTAVKILSTCARGLSPAGRLAEGPVVRSLRIALLLFVVAPGAAKAAEATIVFQDLPVGAVRMPAAAVAPARFDLVAFHWQGPGH